MKKRIIFGILLSFVCGAATVHFVEEYYSTNESNAAYSYGLILLKNGKKDQSIAVFNQAIGLNINNYKPYISLGRLYEKSGKKDFAIEYYEKALELCRPVNSIEKEDKKYIENRLNIIRYEKEKK
jgi:tetratricopeptide (TPR) repeat protein